MRIRRWWIALIPIATLPLSGWLITRSYTTDSYNFLEGRRPWNTGVTGPGSWGPKEVRAYSWKGYWKSVATSAKGELTALGLARRPEIEKRTGNIEGTSPLKDGGLCGTYASTGITFLPGRSLPFSARSSTTDNDPAWVTVLIQTDLPNTWPNIIRYTLFPIPD